MEKKGWPFSCIFSDRVLYLTEAQTSVKRFIPCLECKLAFSLECNHLWNSRAYLKHVPDVHQKVKQEPDGYLQVGHHKMAT